jgi:hypothetical protein
MFWLLGAPERTKPRGQLRPRDFSGQNTRSSNFIRPIVAASFDGRFGVPSI